METGHEAPEHEALGPVLSVGWVDNWQLAGNCRVRGKN